MKRYLFLLGFITIPLIGLPQIKINISETEIANNVCDKRVEFGMVTDLINDDYPRILIKAQMKNESSDSINVSHGIDYYVSYTYRNVSHYIKGTPWNEDKTIGGIYIAPGSSFNTLVLFHPLNFPRQNFMPNFFEIIPTLKLICISDQIGMQGRFESEEIDWTQITVKADSPIGNSRRVEPEEYMDTSN